MYSSTRPRGGWLLRYVLAALIGLAVVAIAAGETETRKLKPIRFNQLQDPASFLTAIHSDKRTKARQEPDKPRRRFKTLDPRRTRPLDHRYRIKSRPLWYDGIWQDQRLVGAVRVIA